MFVRWAPPWPEHSAAAFETEWPAYDQVLVDAETLRHVRPLLRRHALRGYDAIHLAAALRVGPQIGDPLEFWVLDTRLEAAARRERLAVVTPSRKAESVALSPRAFSLASSLGRLLPITR